MKIVLKYLWIGLLLFLAVHGAKILRDEWKRKSVHDKGTTVEVRIEKLDCSRGIMTFYFESMLLEKEIDARTCVMLNERQGLKLKHSAQYPDTFLFVNERSPNRFLSGGLEITLGLMGLLANWPLFGFRRTARKKFRTAP